MSYKTDLYGGRSLRALRANAPAHDRGHPMFHPAKGKGAERPPSSFQQSPQPCRTITGLKRHCREYGRAAAIEARWAAILLWLQHDASRSPSLANPLKVCRVSVGLAREADRWRFSFPNKSGQPFATPALHSLSPECRREARRVADETFTAWQRAGAPYLTADNLNIIQSYVWDCILSGAAISSTTHLQSKDKN
ncbi:hypothetical protein [Sphingobium fuliginis]|uniref:Uncharacterized protein n=1 Tax=Sphingobium fuliginis ATCC 27551 TaxID=1208342 RepID=A0A5B8CBB9_SPHSA|nr:hypothetical protein [Sphingobium fuliginis]QDC36473.1 hypothetical protein FIL70_03650 [Sphingobium fuliginis ATCC 27551]